MKKIMNGWNSNILCWLVLCLEFSFMLCIFAPLNVFFPNQTEFWFSLTDILPMMILAFLIITSILAIIGLVFAKRNLFVFLFDFVLSITIYLYIQGNYVPREYGVLNGSSIDWSSYKGYAITSIVLLTVCGIFGIVLAWKFRNKIFLVGKYIALFLMLVQIITIGTLYVQNHDLAKTGDTKIVTDNKLFELSGKNNILIFILDTFDSKYMQDILEEDDGENYYQLFKDFTYYPDTLSGYPTTKPSLPLILTGEWYENQTTYEEYIRKAYEENVLYKTLKEKDYSVGLYTTDMFIDGDIDFYENVQLGEYKIKNYKDFMLDLTRLVLFNYLPHQLKRYFYLDTAAFDELRSVDGLESGIQAYSTSVEQFYNQLLNKKISISDDKRNCLKLYHTMGVHEPYTFDKELKTIDGREYTPYDEARGNFRVLEEYFKELKDEGLYDSSTIVIMADHGHIDKSQNALFMIKNRDDVGDRLTISDKKMSWDYLRSIWLALVNEEKVDEKFIESCYAGDRRFLYYTWLDTWEAAYLPYMEEYYCRGEAQKVENLIPSGMVYYSKDSGEDYSYTLGDMLEFSKTDSNGYHYAIRELSYGGDFGAWTAGDNVSMRFELEGDYNNLEFDLETSFIFGEYQNVNIYANNNLVSSYVASRGEHRKIVIPAEFIKDNVLVIRFELPDAARPDNGDARRLALAIKSITMSSTDEKMNTNEQFSGQYMMGETINFNKQEDNASPYIISGMSSAEEEGAWTCSESPVFYFNVNEYDGSDLQLMISTLMTFGEQTVEIFVNDKLVDSGKIEGADEYTVDIPANVIDAGQLYIRIHLPNAGYPDNGDQRLLGLFLRSMVIDEK